MLNSSTAQALQLAFAHHQAGRLSEAEAIYRRILAADPNQPDALHLLGLVAQQCGQHEAAATLLGRAAALKKKDAELFAALGGSLGILGRRGEAIGALSWAIAIEPKHFDAHNNLGNVYREEGKLDEAIACFEKALSLNPSFYEARFNRGQALHRAGRPADALADLREAARMRPERVEARRALSDALLVLGQRDECMAILRQLIASDVAIAVDYYNLGVALDESNRRDEAIAEYRKAIVLDPKLAEAHFNLGACLSMGLDVAAAVSEFREAARLKPFPKAGDMVLHFQHHLADSDPRATFELHRQWAREHAEPLGREIVPHRNDRDPARRIRVGYVSADLRRHSVAYFFESLLAAHDPAAVEIVCYADEHRVDATTERFRASGARWRAITGMSDADVAQTVRDDQIDILVDLAGHSQNNRLLVFARKPAPIQVTYLGYPDTTGLTTIDYRLTDAHADPAGMTESLHTEQLIRLPECAWCYRPDDNSPPIERAPAGDFVTFGSFGVASKINAPLIEMWAEILRAVPGSRMLIKTGHGHPSLAHPAIRDEFAKHAIPAERIELVSFVPNVTEHLRLFSRVDVALDTFPYNGTTTICEALWMGVPVVSLAGRTHASRVGASLLSAVGLDDLVAESREQYIEIAATFARDRARRDGFGDALRRRMMASPLMDGARLARSIEAAYRLMWETWCAG